MFAQLSGFPILGQLHYSACVGLATPEGQRAWTHLCLGISDAPALKPDSPHDLAWHVARAVMLDLEPTRVIRGDLPF